MNSMQTCSLLSLVIAVALILISHSCQAGEIVTDEGRGFKLMLPDGFVPVPELVGVAPSIVHAFGREDPETGDLRIVLMIEDLGGTIGRERITMDHLPTGFKGKLFTTQWKGFEVDGIEVPEEADGRKAIALNVQIPLKPTAIQVKLWAFEAHRPELDGLLATTLRGLEGESNWIPSAVPALKVSSSENYGTVLLCLAIAFVAVCLVVLWLISKRAPRGTVLVIAVILYIAGVAVSGKRVREIAMLAGSLKILGVAAALIGIADLTISRRRDAQPEN